jgi:hypothetical protein
MLFRVAHQLNDLDHSEDNRKRFPVVWLRLKTSNGQVFYSGEELRPRFKKHSNSLYELAYR